MKIREKTEAHECKEALFYDINMSEESDTEMKFCLAKKQKGELICNMSINRKWAMALLVMLFSFSSLFWAEAEDGKESMGTAPYREGDGRHIMFNADELEWSDIASMPEPAEISVIEGKLDETEPFTFRLWMPDGFIVAPHIHPEYERVTVIKGTFHFAHGSEFDRTQTKALQEGAIAIMPPGHAMFGYTEGETIIQLHGTGPWAIEYINPEDDPRSQ